MAAFDRLRPDDVRWTPYSMDDILVRAPNGLSSFCTRDQDYWLTRKAVVFDIFVEDYAPHRVMRQFGRHQTFPLPVAHVVPLSVHG